MGIIKKTIKLGTPLAVAYLTVEQRLWSQLSHQEINDKLSAVKNYEKQAISFVAAKTNIDVTAVKKWMPDFNGTIDATTVWNKSVKTVFKTLSDIDLKELSKKLIDMTTSSGTK